jgi:hypothetical protein
MQIIIANKFYSKNKYTLNEIYLILLKTQSKLQYYVCYALKYIFPFNNFCFDILFSTTFRGRVLYKSTGLSTSQSDMHFVVTNFEILHNKILLLVN